MYNGTPANAVGPILRRLRGYGPVKGLVVGAHAESSDDLMRLVKLISTIGAERTWRSMGAKDEKMAKAANMRNLLDALSIEAMRGIAQLRISRLAYAAGGGNLKKAVARRAAAQFNHDKRRLYMENRGSYTRDVQRSELRRF